MTQSYPFNVEGLVRKSATRAPFTLEESKMLLDSLDSIEKNYDEKAVEELPATVQLPPRSSTKMILVAWVLCNVGELPFLRYRISPDLFC